MPGADLVGSRRDVVDAEAAVLDLGPPGDVELATKLYEWISPKAQKVLDYWMDHPDLWHTGEDTAEAAGLNGKILPLNNDGTSDVLWFNPTVMNEGSGDWWIYGEDHRYYYFIGDGRGRYKMFPKERAQSCQGFDPTRSDTWCP